MRLPENNNDISDESAGVGFVKRIGLLGAILFLLLSIIGTLLMLFAGRGEKNADPQPIEPYSTSVSFSCYL